MKRILEPLTVSAAEAAELLSISRSTLYEWNTLGRVPSPVRIGGRTLWDYVELQRWVGAGCPPRVRWEVMREGRP